MSYAENTKVTVEKSESELKALLRKYGADRIATGFDHGAGLAVVNFAVSGRMVRLQINVPKLDEIARKASNDPPHGWRGWSVAKRQEWVKKEADQIERQRWRALVLVTKAKLELIAEGLSTMEREFLADLVLPGNQTVYHLIAPTIEQAYSTGKLPPLLPGIGG